jgi:16S rRNA (cytosine1407-C5)-methyltransferase
VNELFYRLPKEFLKKLEAIYPSHYQQILSTFLAKKTTTFRINYLKIDLVDLRKELLKEGVRFQELNFPQGAFICKTPLRDLQQKEVYRNGLIYVQNVSSQLPVLFLDPQGKEKILDLCAAPGAKTTQIASLAKEAEITAIEKIRTRYYKLLANLKVQGAQNVNTVLIDGIWVRKKFPEYFDKILVDAPCSVESRFLIHDHHTFNYWKERKVKEMEHKQKKLLHAAFFALKEGATLVYSTCTFSPEENEEVIDWFIDKFKDKLEVVPIDIALPNVFTGLNSWQGKRFSSAMRLARRIIPNDFMEGFFIAKLKKIAV